MSRAKRARDEALEGGLKIVESENDCSMKIPERLLESYYISDFMGT